MDNRIERWLPVPGFEDSYRVSDSGRVRGTRGLLKGALNSKGYRVVWLWKPGRRPKVRLVHRLVLAAFVAAPEPGQQCRHLDGDPLNNHLANLAWGTASENQLDTVAHGTHNQARKTLCPQGHPYDYRRGDGSRGCRTCTRAVARASAKRSYAAKRKATA